MKQLLTILLIIAASFLPQAQENFYTFDITDTWDEMGDVGGWSVGNAWNEPYAEYEYFGTLNFYYRDLEMMNSKLRVYGDTINVGVVTKRFPASDIIVEPTLSTTEPTYKPLDLKMYPNPSEVYVIFEGVYIERVSIYNSVGQIVFRGRPNKDKFTIITSDWVSGTYIVQLWGLDNRGIFKKLIRK